MKYLIFLLLSCNPGQPRYEPEEPAEVPRQKVDTVKIDSIKVTTKY